MCAAAQSIGRSQLVPANRSPNEKLTCCLQELPFAALAQTRGSPRWKGDVAGFARTNPDQSVNGNWGINAYMGDPNGNPANLSGNWYGHVRLLDRGGTGNACANGTFTYIGANNEILEGTLKQDVLVGNDIANTLWGRPGDDELFGNGGDDVLRGDDGADRLLRRRRQRPLPGRRRL